MKPTRQRSLVLGLGVTGLSVARFLCARHQMVAVADTREEPPALAALREELPDVAVFLGARAAAALDHADRVIVSPGLSLREPVLVAARERGLPILGDIELFAREVSGQVVAITGSNGKSTVTTLVGMMSREVPQRTEVGGNLGVAALDLLARRQSDLYVLELSSFQLETTESLHTRVSAVLNLSADHMDRYRDIDEYAAAKQRILRHAGTAVLNRDDPVVMAMGAHHDAVVSFGLDAPSAAHDYGVSGHGDDAMLVRGKEPLLAVRELLVSGRHNIANALAALAIGEAAGLRREAMLRVLRTFPGLEHRSQWIACIHDVDYFNDSKGTNVGATVAAVTGLQRSLILIAGGDGKGADFAPLAPAVRAHARAVVLLGRDAPQLAAALADTVPLHHVRSMREAVGMAASLAEPGDAVLLSPACASFDMFRDYQERGRAFVAAVREMKG